MFFDEAHEGQEQREQDIKLDGEQYIIQLIRGTPRHDVINQRREKCTKCGLHLAVENKLVEQQVYE